MSNYCKNLPQSTSVYDAPSGESACNNDKNIIQSAYIISSSHHAYLFERRHVFRTALLETTIINTQFTLFH